MEEAAAQDLHQAIQESLVPTDGILTHWVVVGSYLDEQGERQQLLDTSDGMADFERDGLLFNSLFGDDWEEDDDE